MAVSGFLYYGNDHTVELSGLKDAAGVEITGATVEMSLLDYADRTPVAGATWPMAMTEDAPGEYSVSFDKLVNIAVSTKYWITITVVKADLNAQWDFDALCRYRTP